MGTGDLLHTCNNNTPFSRDRDPAHESVPPADKSRKENAVVLLENTLKNRQVIEEELLAREQERAMRRERLSSSGTEEELPSSSSPSSDSGVTMEPNQIETTYDGRPLLAKLSVSDLQARGLELQPHHQIYLTITMEGVCKTTDRSPEPSPDGKIIFSHPNTDPLQFNVSDVAANLMVALYSKPQPQPGAQDLCVGKVIVPLSRLYKDAFLPRLLSRRHNHFSFDSWFELYPVKPSQNRFELAIPGLSGLSPSRKSLGQLHLRLELQTKPGYPLALCAFLNPPFTPTQQPSTPSFSASQSAASLSHTLKAVKYNELRLQALLASIKATLDSIRSVRHWERPQITGLLLAWHTYACLYAACWQLPMLITVLVVGCSLAFPYAPSGEAPQMYTSETARIRNGVKDDDQFTQDFSLTELASLLTKISCTTERLFNAFNWTDKIASLGVSLAVLLTGLAASVFAFGLHVFTTHCLPLHHILYIGGVLFLSPSVIDKVQCSVKKAASAILNRAKVSESAIWQCPAVCIQMLCNLNARILDAEELVHRRIASTQEVQLP